MGNAWIGNGTWNRISTCTWNQNDTMNCCVTRDERRVCQSNTKMHWLLECIKWSCDLGVESDSNQENGKEDHDSRI